MNTPSNICRNLFLTVAILFTTNLFSANSTISAADKAEVIEETRSYKTPAVKKAEANSLIFFLEKAEYFTISIMDSEGQMIVNREVKGNQGLNDFSLASIPAGNTYTYSIVGETMTSKRGVLQGI